MIKTKHINRHDESYRKMNRRDEKQIFINFYKVYLLKSPLTIEQVQLSRLQI